MTILSDPPKDSQFCENQEVILVCHANDVTKPAYEWFTSKSNLSDQSSSITVYAPPISLEYYCNVTDLVTERNGQAGIVITGNGETYMYSTLRVGGGKIELVRPLTIMLKLLLYTCQ